VIRTGRGTLIAFAEARASTSDSGSVVVVAKRSEDTGHTWGPARVVTGDGSDTRGNPAPVVDPRTGHIILLTCRNAADTTEAQITAGKATAQQSRRIYLQRSTDDGRTFSPPTEITAEVKRPDWRWYATGPGHAIALTRGPYKGRLIVAANHSTAPPPGSPDTGAEAKYYGAHCCYSDDSGRTWQIGFSDDTPDGRVNANESTAAQLSNGQIYFNTRNQNGTAPGVRCDAYSNDGGLSLTHPYKPQAALTGPVVEGNVLQPDNGPLLFSGPADPASRRRMTIRASLDQGHTWHAVHTLSNRPAAYSDMVPIGPNEIGLLYETGTKTPNDTITFTTLPLRTLIPPTS
jgi:sialidase-1